MEIETTLAPDTEALGEIVFVADGNIINDVEKVPSNSPSTSLDIEAFERILKFHKNQEAEHCWSASTGETGLRDSVEKRLCSHRSSDPELHAALRRLHQLRVQKHRLDKQIIRICLLLESSQNFQYGG